MGNDIERSVKGVRAMNNPLSEGQWTGVPNDTPQYAFKATSYGWVPKKV